MASKGKRSDFEINEHNRGYYVIAVIIIAICMGIAFVTATPEQREELMNFGGITEQLPDQVKIFGTN